eukprot:TRINITY_DN3010_c0_g1_i3.p1 TRINITY_DN3010_c0_g1~~TRINITY_DN3010_c0_g1_i3.p1  ORF type:complete len:276 (+),score=18.23 TRINITY_DN3010_c0_g1_i3:20-847(+)
MPEYQSIWDIFLTGNATETYWEEVASSITHLIGAILSAIATYFLILIAVHFRKSWHHVWGLTVYGLSMVTLYTLSTIYHLAGVYYQDDPEVKYNFQKWDHIGIYFLIAGTYTPLVLIGLIKKSSSAKVGYGILFFVWFCAIAGSIFKVAFPIEIIPEYVSHSLFVFQGCSVLVVFRTIVKETPSIVLSWLVIGGGFYLGGIWWLVWDKFHFNHAVWHLHVMVGTLSHLFAILYIATPIKERPTFQYIINKTYEDFNTTYEQFNNNKNNTNNKKTN